MGDKHECGSEEPIPGGWQCPGCELWFRSMEAAQAQYVPLFQWEGDPPGYVCQTCMNESSEG